ncbi:MAG: type III secretion system inner membrane ring subunit SctD [Desulfovibrio sp.]|jgi:type III secretion protein D|nr:type III secretion system inner membrane ring subunit SctD [Desulfovibrio sp.]
MGEAEVIIALRTFSGPNLGAEVMLPPGTYTIGTGRSCDIVLSDSSMAPRHAALRAELSLPGRHPRVHVKPLDGDIFLEEEALPAEGRDIPPATPWFLGLTCLSWNTPNATREEIVPRLPGLSAQSPVRAEPANPVGRNASGNEENAHASNIVGNKPPTPLPRRRRWPVRLAALLILTITGILALEFRDSPESTEDLTLKLRQELRQAGLDNILVNSENGRVTVSGSVLNEKERGLIWSMARNLKCPVYVRVNVREDLAQAVKLKLNSSGVFPEVTFPDGGEAMRIAAYIKDVQTENTAFASLNKDLPGLPRIEKRVVHAAELKTSIERELERAGLGNINIVLGAGRVELTDASSSGNHDALRRAMQRVEEDLNVPLAYTIVSRDSPPGGESDSQALDTLVPDVISPDMPSGAFGSSPLDEARVTGVTMGPMRFISLGNGQRIFEGGVLPGGHVLESISLDALVLNKNGRTTTYPLRGNNERRLPFQPGTTGGEAGRRP